MLFIKKNIYLDKLQKKLYINTFHTFFNVRTMK